MTENLSFARQAMRLVAAASLACTVATVGCSTDRTPGAGEPQRYAPSVSPTMPNSTPGTEQNRPVNPPMISSYTAPNAVISRQPNLDALAIAAANQSFRGRYLGPADPGGTPSYANNPQGEIATGQFINPSLAANPEITVNRSISSDAYPVVTSGGTGVFVGSTGGVAVTTAGTSAIVSGVTTTPTTAATTLTPTTAASTVATTSNAANAPAAVINNRGGLLTPTMSSGSTLSPTVAANPGISNTITGNTLSTASTSGLATGTTTTSTTSRLVGAGSGNVVVLRNTGGTVTITNRGGDGTVAPATTVTAPLTLSTGKH